MTRAQLVNSVLDEHMDAAIERAVPLGDFLVEYYSQVKRSVASGGKRIRPVLAISAFEAVKGELPSREIVEAFLSLELIHAASLIHDDIIDNDDTRRGYPAFHAFFREKAKTMKLDLDEQAYGLAMGILGGDAAYNLAYHAIINAKEDPRTVLEASKVFNETFKRIVDGVIKEMTFVGLHDVDEDDYVDMVERKTAALFTGSCKLGALFAGGTVSHLDAFENYGNQMGNAFQIVDDVIGSFGDPAVTGKPVDSDIREGKKTLLLIRAFKMADDADKEILKKIVGNPDISASEVDDVRAVFERTGAKESVLKTAEELLAKSIDSLGSCDPPLKEVGKQMLAGIANMGVHRKS